MTHSGRRLMYSSGYVAALTVARADLAALAGTFQRDYVALRQEVEDLRAEISELRKLAGVRDPALPLN